MTDAQGNRLQTQNGVPGESSQRTSASEAPFERDWLAVFYKVALSISRELELQNLLLLIMNEVRTVLRADRCTVFLRDEETGELWSLAAHGEREIRFPAHLGIAGEVLRTGKMLNIPDAYQDSRFNREIDQRTGYRTRSVLAAPLRNRAGEVIGVFQVLNKEGGPFTREDELLLDAISGLAATQIENAQLYAEQKLFLERTIEALANSIDARDPLTAGHSKRVALLCAELAKQLELGEDDREKLRISALLHDYGKIGVRDYILYKMDRLESREVQVMKDHPTKTREILERIRFPKKLRDVPLIASAHHERLDGSGYPLGLRGEEIPFLARVLAVADVFEAMTARRTYREPLHILEVVQEIQAGAGVLYDPRCVQALCGISLLRFLEIHADGQPDFVLPQDHREILGGKTIGEFVRELTEGKTSLVRSLFEHYYRIAIRGGLVHA
ncbi:MAG: GAF domain-containing protein [candidate division KSB1 bacterium]|nr:GAF domain-containing protein [candidate division KSB1 bacterium]